MSRYALTANYQVCAICSRDVELLLFGFKQYFPLWPRQTLVLRSEVIVNWRIVWPIQEVSYSVAFILMGSLSCHIWSFIIWKQKNRGDYPTFYFAEDWSKCHQISMTANKQWRRHRHCRTLDWVYISTTDLFTDNSLVSETPALSILPVGLVSVFR